MLKGVVLAEENEGKLTASATKRTGMGWLSAGKATAQNQRIATTYFSNYQSCTIERVK